MNGEMLEMTCHTLAAREAQSLGFGVVGWSGSRGGWYDRPSSAKCLDVVRAFSTWVKSVSNKKL